MAQSVRRRRARHHAGQQARHPRRGEVGRRGGQGEGWTDEELDAKSALAKALGLRPPKRWTPDRGGWTADEVALLGTDHDKVIAEKLGRTAGAVTSQRTLRKIRAFSGSPGGGRAWADEELALLGTDTDEAVAERIGRTTIAVAQKRAARKVPTFHDRRSR